MGEKLCSRPCEAISTPSSYLTLASGKKLSLHSFFPALAGVCLGIVLSVVTCIVRSAFARIIYVHMPMLNAIPQLGFHSQNSIIHLHAFEYV